MLTWYSISNMLWDFRRTIRSSPIRSLVPAGMTHRIVLYLAWHVGLLEHPRVATLVVMLRQEYMSRPCSKYIIHVPFGTVFVAWRRYALPRRSKPLEVLGSIVTPSGYEAFSYPRRLSMSNQFGVATPAGTWWHYFETQPDRLKHGVSLHPSIVGVLISMNDDYGMRHHSNPPPNIGW